MKSAEELRAEDYREGRRGNVFAPAASTWQPVWSSPSGAATSQFPSFAAGPSSAAVGKGGSPDGTSSATMHGDGKPSASIFHGWCWPDLARPAASSTTAFGSPASMDTGGGRTPQTVGGSTAKAGAKEQGTPGGSVFSNPLFGAAASPPSAGAGAGGGATPGSSGPIPWSNAFGSPSPCPKDQTPGGASVAAAAAGVSPAKAEAPAGGGSPSTAGASSVVAALEELGLDLPAGRRSTAHGAASDPPAAAEGAGAEAASAGTAAAGAGAAAGTAAQATAGASQGASGPSADCAQSSSGTADGGSNGSAREGSSGTDACHPSCSAECKKRLRHALQRRQQALAELLPQSDRV
ncbi:hypothetical protein ABPG77_000360 [Micractinium sp. CCAP 211/92]